MQFIPNYPLRIRLRQGLARSQTLFWHELRALRSPEHLAENLAAAFALGTLLSFIPIPFLDSMLVALIVTRFKLVNRASLFMARLLWNDLVVFPFYGLGYRIGAALLTPLINANPPLPVWNTAVTPVFSFILGNLLLAAALSVTGYLAFWLAIVCYRSSRVASGG